jgi:uncharacterized protein
MTPPQDTCLILFVKYPKKGLVKLRLCKDLNENNVLDLYRCFVQDTLETIKKTDIPFFICFHPPEEKQKFLDWLGPTYEYLPQQGQDLGERMKNSFTTVFTKGYQKAILLGSDSPDIPPEYITNARKILQTKDIVLGPTVDGGYYLIGFQTATFTPTVFDDIPWSTPQVLQKTLMKIRQENRSIGFLPVWSDIDTVSDLKTLMNRSRNTSFISSNTMTYVQTHQICRENNDGEDTGAK